MDLTLPPAKPYKLCTDLENGWSDQYGALPVAAAYAGIDVPDRYFNGIWQHGCFGPWMSFQPRLLCYNSPIAERLPVFVARTDQAEYLRQNGYAHARAIGMPITYLPALSVPRIPKSLLVVPTHTLNGAKFSDKSGFARYVSEIEAVRDRFDHITVCIHPSCRKNGLWVNEFSARGFDIVYGAQNDDANALLRIATLFAQFETITTNGWGSHIAYGLAAGARVSIYGTQVVELANYLADAAWSNNRPAIETALVREAEAATSGILRPFVAPPHQALADVELGQWLVGQDCRVSPGQMREILMSCYTLQPRHLNGGTDGGVALYNQLTQKWRSKLSEGLEHAKRKQSAAAAQAMLGGVLAVQACQYPRVILEALVEICPHLAHWDAPRARHLLGLACQMAEQMDRPLAHQRTREVQKQLDVRRSSLGRQGGS